MYRDTAHNATVFDSAAEMARYCVAENICKGASYNSWCGGLTLQQEVHNIITGDDTNAAMAKELLAQFMRDIELPSQALVPEVAGAFPLVPEYLGGDPECFLAMEPINSTSAPLEIVVDPTCSSGLSAKNMRDRGIAVLALVMALSAVRPITLTICGSLDSGPQYAKPWGRISFVKIPINTTPLDLATASFLLTHVGIARRFIYEILGVHWNAAGTWPHLTNANGQSPQDENTQREMLLAAGYDPDNTLFIAPSISIHEPALKDPVGYVQDMFNKFRPQ